MSGCADLDESVAHTMSECVLRLDVACTTSYLAARFPYFCWRCMDRIRKHILADSIEALLDRSNDILDVPASNQYFLSFR